MAKSTEERIKEIEEKRNQLNARLQKLRAQENAKARKARTHRLIQVGAVVERSLDMELTDADLEYLSEALNTVDHTGNQEQLTFGTRLARIINEYREVQQRKQEEVQHSDEWQQPEYEGENNPF